MPQVGSYKNKQKALKDLDKAGDVSTPKNPVDRLSEEMNREDENNRGITDYIRNIFAD
jgi:hypothetical protein